MTPNSVPSTERHSPPGSAATDTVLDCVLGDCDWWTATPFPHCIDEYLQHLEEDHDADAA